MFHVAPIRSRRDAGDGGLTGVSGMTVAGVVDVVCSGREARDQATISGAPRSLVWSGLLRLQTLSPDRKL